MSARRTLVISHADADGHLIAEQVRRNLSHLPSLDVTTLVDPNRTQGHRMWTRLAGLPEIEAAEWVFFVDLMFAPATFADEARSLVAFALERPSKLFFVLDHHPLPLRLLSEASNLRAVYRQDVLDCAIGPRTSMMILAALCEDQPTRAIDLKRPIHDDLAEGMRRAAAPGGPLPGEKLLTLLRFDCWDELAELGRDDPKRHHLPRGRRPLAQPSTDALDRLSALAGDLKEMSERVPHSTKDPTRETMPYDLESLHDNKPPQLAIRPAHSTDLEAIVTLLELAALYLTRAPGAEFTREALVNEARKIGGPEINLNETDIDIVVGKAGFLKKVNGSKLSLR